MYENRNSNPIKILFWSILSLAIAIRIALVIFIPFGQKVEHRLEGLNDEPAHFNYVKYLAMHRAFPVQRISIQDTAAFARNEFEYYQPPLYYAAGALLYGVAGERISFLLCRLFSFFCGIATVFCIGLIIRKVDTAPLVRYGAMMFAALLPAHAYFCALVSNDALCWLFAALIIYECADIGPVLQWKKAGLLCLYLTAGMLTKTSITILYPLVVAACLYSYFRNRNAAVLLQCALIIVVSLLCAAPWYVRNLQLYGSFLAVSTGFGPPVENFKIVHNILAFPVKVIHYFWFPMQHIVIGSTGVRLCNYTGGIIVAVHGAAAAWYLLREKQRTYGTLFLASALLLAIFALLRINMAYPEPEGRFLFPALAAIAFYFAAPAKLFFERINRAHLVIAELALIALYPYAFLLFVTP